MVIMVVMVPPLVAVLKLAPSRPLWDRVMGAMVIMELLDRLLRLDLNLLPLDRAMGMAMMEQAVPMLDHSHKIRVNLPSDPVVNGQNIANREKDMVCE